MPLNLINHHPQLSTATASRCRRAALCFMSRMGVLEIQLSLVLTTDEEMAEFNGRYRNQPKTTNVLSFAFSGSDDPAVQSLFERELGDIVVSLDTAAAEAKRYDLSLQQRLDWLIAHGLLHLLGFDHEGSEQAAKTMYEKEQELLTEYNLRRSSIMPHLAVNVDHVATIRQARGIHEPDPVTAAAICEMAGAQGIVVHLREDRRHIQDRDVRLLKETVKTKLNLEMGAAKSIIDFALELKPDMVTLVPEKRKELTTEGGLDVVSQKKKLVRTISKMDKAGIPVSLFIDPDRAQIRAADEVGATFVELHTGTYADAEDEVRQLEEFDLLSQAAEEAYLLGLRVNAGHGLNYHNTGPIAALDPVEELSIGHAIVSRSVFSGLDQAVRDMCAIVESGTLY
jgi:pyridoxine 5-phosphate synthase